MASLMRIYLSHVSTAQTPNVGVESCHTYLDTGKPPASVDGRGDGVRSKARKNKFCA
jgi:hypothetical protein